MADESKAILNFLAVLMEKIRNGEIGAKDLEKFLGGSKKFENLETLEIKVPEDWTPGGALEALRQEFEEKEYSFDSDVTNEHFKASALHLGQKVKIHICEIKKPVSSDECLEFIKSQGGFCFGAKDAALIWQVARDQLPEQKWLIFMGKKDGLWTDSDARARVPVLYRYSGGVWDFNLRYFDHDWHPGACLVFASAA